MGIQQAADGRPRIPATFPDGMSNTILFGEKYAHCVGPVNQYLTGLGPLNLPAGGDSGNYWTCNNLDDTSSWFTGFHPGFSLSIWEVETGFASPPIEPFSIGPASVFQYQPLDGVTCNPILASTAHTGGMVTCFADASAHVLTPTINGMTWWALCTPQGGENVLDEGWR